MMASLTKTSRIDVINIGLLLFSCAMAFVIPFELFLFVYAVLGPLHYLTEISWLHDKNYYAKDKRDIILLVVLSLLITMLSLGWFSNAEWINTIFDQNDEGVGLRNFNSYLTFVGFAAALFFTFVRKPILKIMGVIIALLAVAISNKFWVFFAVFLPTLIHVFVFTSLFMLYGALKSKSNIGILTVALHLLCPFLLFYLFPGEVFLGTEKGLEMYDGSVFKGLNQHMLFNMDMVDLQQFQGMSIKDAMFKSTAGVAIMRFIAFAYTYHYLNWFSKTEIIRWHKVPKARFAVVILAWVVSVVLYAVDYKLGFQWLFLLSFMHVMLEFPLNYVSVVGIFQEVKARVLKPA